MDKLFDFLKTLSGGKKIAVCLVVFIASVVFFAVGRLSEDNWVGMSQFLVLVAIAANVTGMGIHAFAKNKVSGAVKVDPNSGP